MRILFLLLTVTLGGVLERCTTVFEPLPPVTADNQSSVVIDETRIQRGIEVYNTYYCGDCHTLAAAGTTAELAPGHDLAALHALERLADPFYTGSATTPEEYLRESILMPEAYFVPEFAVTQHLMPSYALMPEEELEALVYLLSHQRGE